MSFLRDRLNVNISDLGINASAGTLRGISSEYKFGVNNDIGSSIETVWDIGGLYAYPSAATTMTVSSGSTTDNAAGIGARTIYVEGLDLNYNVINETLTLHATNGQLGVTTVNSYLRIHRAYVLTAGSNDGCVGILYIGTGTLTVGIPANIYGALGPDYNQTTQTPFTIPAGKTGFITQGYASLSSNKDATVIFVARTPGEIFTAKFVMNLYQSPLVYPFAQPLPIPEKTDLELRAIVPLTAGAISATYEMILVDNDLL